jgi:aminopeptidase N
LRVRFVGAGLAPAAVVRARCFGWLAGDQRRRREVWVIEGLSYLHHPLRAPWSQRFIEPSLRMLREIQRTGDIFFPKNWLDATLGGHASAEAADRVREFLRSLPAGYPPRLRDITLQSADELFRAAR